MPSLEFDSFNNQLCRKLNQVQKNDSPLWRTPVETPDFNLPKELQGGISNISSRRPSYAAEFSNRSGNELLGSAGWSNIFQPPGLNHSRRSSAFNFPAPVVPPFDTFSNEPTSNEEPLADLSTVNNLTSFLPLEDDLILENNRIMASPTLRSQFLQTINYFGNMKYSLQILERLVWLAKKGVKNDLDLRFKVEQLIKMLKARNNDLTSQSKRFALITNKNNRLDVIALARNSNLYIQRYDLVIVEGDRGTDLVMVLDPCIDLDVAILFNFLKKKQHLRSLEYGQEKKHVVNTGSVINEDAHFITLPNKQVLRFAKPAEVQQLCIKFNDEVMAWKLCVNYASSLHLKMDIKNVEFQFDKKKLIIYFFSNKRLDFRTLVKELFKLYKTRIWLCAILPIEEDAKNFHVNTQSHQLTIPLDSIPGELTTYPDFQTQEPIFFHAKIFNNLLTAFEEELKGSM